MGEESIENDEEKASSSSDTGEDEGEDAPIPKESREISEKNNVC